MYYYSYHYYFFYHHYYYNLSLSITLNINTDDHIYIYIECFRRIGVDNDPDLMRDDPAVRAMYEETEEGKKVARLGGQKFFAVFERLPDDEIIRSPLDELWS